MDDDGLNDGAEGDSRGKTRKGKRRRIFPVAFLCFLLYLLYGYIYDDTAYFRLKVDSLLQNKNIAICRLGNLTNFRWDEVKLSPKGIILANLRMEFISRDGNKKILMLPLGRYHCDEEYVPHSPLEKKFNPSSCFILTKVQPNDGRFIHFQPLRNAFYFQMRNVFYFQTLGEDAFYFLSQLLHAEEDAAIQAKASLLTKFIWQRMTITFHQDQHTYAFDFMDEDSRIVRSFTIPNGVFSIGMASKSKRVTFEIPSEAMLYFSISLTKTPKISLVNYSLAEIKE